MIDETYVSTDDKEIAETVRGLAMGVKILSRPFELATDTATTESVMLHFANTVADFDVLVTIQATSPLLESSHLDEALKKFDCGQYDSMLSAVRTKRFFWSDSGVPLNYAPEKRPRRQDFPGVLMENGAFYITTSALLLKNGCRLGGRIGIYEMPNEAGAEIDEADDWDEVEQMLARKTEQSAR